MLEETQVESNGERSTWKLVAKARPQQTSNSTLSSVSIPYLERKWIDVEPGTFDPNCLEVSKLMIRLLRHDDSINRENDGAVKFEDLASIYQSRIMSSSHWSIRTWLSLLQRGGGMKKIFQLYNKVYQSGRLPHRAVLKPNLYHGRQDLSNFEARTSVDHQSKEREEYGETRSDSKSYRGTKEFWETHIGNIDFKIQGLPHSTVQKQDDIRQETGPPIWNTPKSRIAEGPNNQPVQREVAGINLQHGKHGELRDVRDHFQSTLPRLLTILRNRHCILYLRYTLATFTQESQIDQRSVWWLVSPELCNKEGTTSRSTTRTNWEEKDLFHSSQCSQEGKKERVPAVSRLTSPRRVGWTYLGCLWRDRSRGPLLPRRPK